MTKLLLPKAGQGSVLVVLKKKKKKNKLLPPHSTFLIQYYTSSLHLFGIECPTFPHGWMDVCMEGQSELKLLHHYAVITLSCRGSPRGKKKGPFRGQSFLSARGSLVLATSVLGRSLRLRGLLRRLLRQLGSLLGHLLVEECSLLRREG